VEVLQVLEVPVVLVQHHAVRLPELPALEHRPHRRVEGDRVDTHQAHALRDQVTGCLGGHPAVIGAVALLVVVGLGAGVDEDDVPLL